jgi:hypothetical protein
MHTKPPIARFANGECFSVGSVIPTVPSVTKLWINDRVRLLRLYIDKPQAIDAGRLRFGDRLPYSVDSLPFLLA